MKLRVVEEGGCRGADGERGEARSSGQVRSVARALLDSKRGVREGLFRLIWLTAAEVLAVGNGVSASPMLLLRFRGPKIWILLVMLRIPLRILSLNPLDLTTTAATSALDTVTND